ncbi:KilA-N domain-containing protein [Spirosoma rhododendri]|uniref:KilA-N domain-containing protein n=1 Tax=Spirosoma rhododendri TaxID=2728024 RepID=A0A7L5DQR2_9BACT|nr:KilA-N domain-containing protein [Spirosoma rhododendri]QJD79573.1 KilA-N domain-containing protein [Spirosoma rhododendri]
MNSQIIKFSYEGQEVEFDTSDPKLMVNATEVAKIFGKLTADFFRLDQTKAFINECLNYGNSHNSDGEKNGHSRFLGINNQDDLYTSRRRSGTWMHRILALKFAAWLDPRFELWVYLTIDQIIQGQHPLPIELLAERKQILNERNFDVEEAKRTEAELLESDVFRRWQEQQGRIKSSNTKLKAFDRKVMVQLDMFSKPPVKQE